jgi:hypothetical protein
MASREGIMRYYRFGSILIMHWSQGGDRSPVVRETGES